VRLAQQLDAGGRRHLQVSQKHVERAGRDRLQRVRRMGEAGDVEALATERHAKGLEVGRFVVDDQDARLSIFV